MQKKKKKYDLDEIMDFVLRKNCRKRLKIKWKKHVKGLDYMEQKLLFLLIYLAINTVQIDLYQKTIGV